MSSFDDDFKNDLVSDSDMDLDTDSNADLDAESDTNLDVGLDSDYDEYKALKEQIKSCISAADFERLQELKTQKENKLIYKMPKTMLAIWLHDNEIERKLKGDITSCYNSPYFVSALLRLDERPNDLVLLWKLTRENCIVRHARLAELEVEASEATDKTIKKQKQEQISFLKRCEEESSFSKKTPHKIIKHYKEIILKLIRASKNQIMGYADKEAFFTADDERKFPGIFAINDMVFDNIKAIEQQAAEIARIEIKNMFEALLCNSSIGADYPQETQDIFDLIVSSEDCDNIGIKFIENEAAYTEWEKKLFNFCRKILNERELHGNYIDNYIDCLNKIVCVLLVNKSEITPNEFQPWCPPRAPWFQIINDCTRQNDNSFLKIGFRDDYTRYVIDDGYEFDFEFLILEDAINCFLGEDVHAAFFQHFSLINNELRGIYGYKIIERLTKTKLQQLKQDIRKKFESFEYKQSLLFDIDSNTKCAKFSKRQIAALQENFTDIKKKFLNNIDMLLEDEIVSKSFINSEWYCCYFDGDKDMDNTSLVTGYLKSMEQLICKYLKSKGVDSQNMTMGEMCNNIRLNKLLQINNPDVNDVVLKELEYWTRETRNGYFHKDNLVDVSKITHIIDVTYFLYFLVLGSFNW